MTVEAFINREGEDWNAEEEEDYREFLKEEEKAGKAEARANDPIAVECTYVCFVSRSNGRGRKARIVPRQVELIGYGGRFYSVSDGKGPFDEIATEVLGEGVDPKEAEKIFLERVRRL